MEPIVEDAVPDVDRADETLRLMRLYGLLAAAVTQAAAALAAAAPTLCNGRTASFVKGASELHDLAQAPTLLNDDALPLSGLMTKLIADAVGAGLLPPKFDGAANARLSVRRVLRPPQRSATGGEEGFAAAVPLWDDPKKDDPKKDETDDEALETAPSPWYEHVLC